MEKSKTDILSEIYYDISNPASFSSVEKLLRESRKVNPYITRNDVEAFLSSQTPYTVHRRARKRFKRNPILVDGPNEMAQADLIDLQKLNNENEGKNFLLTMIDVFSKKAYVQPIKSKSGIHVSDAMARIFKEYIPSKLQTDEGKEFLNSHVQKLLDGNLVQFFVAKNKDIKCSIVERFHRTLLGKLYKYFTAFNTYRYIDVLQELVNSYNETVHRSIKMKPNDVNSDNTPLVFRNLYGYNDHRDFLMHMRGKPRMSKGDKVRVQFKPNTFSKGYTPNFSFHLFTVDKAVSGKDRPTYKLKDWKGKYTPGRWYPAEIQKVNHIYKIEGIIKRKMYKGEYQYFVKWKDLPPEHNSWISESDIEKY